MFVKTIKIKKLKKKDSRNVSLGYTFGKSILSTTLSSV